MDRHPVRYRHDSLKSLEPCRHVSPFRIRSLGAGLQPQPRVPPCAPRLPSLLRMDENMLDIGSILCHMYFLKPSPTATSLKHCLQKLSPYFLTMGPYWPQRLHGRAPFPYFLCFFAFSLVMTVLSFLCLSRSCSA